MNTKYLTILTIFAIAIILGSVAAYIFLSQPATSSITLQGAGATFPYPLLDSMINTYSENVKPGVHVNYQSIGSGGGISAMRDKTVDFGASDAPLTASDIINVPNTVHIPETIGAVTVAYNLPGISSGYTSRAGSSQTFSEANNTMG